MTDPSPGRRAHLPTASSSGPAVPYLLLALLLAGGFLRLHALGLQSLWYDEAFHRVVVVNTSWRDVWGVMLSFVINVPLPFVLMKLATHLFGVSEFGLRVPSALIGWLAIPVTYRLGRKVFGQAAGVLSATFIAFSPFAVWFSRDTRPYALYLLLAALVLWCFWRAERSGRTRDWAAFIASSAALYLTHYVSALFVYAQAAYLVTRLRRQPLTFHRWALAQAVAVLPLLGWGAAFWAVGHPLRAPTPLWIPPVTLVTPLQTLWNFASGDAGRATPVVLAGAACLMALMALGARGLTPRVQLLLWWLILPVAAAWAVSLLRPVLVDRYLEPAILPVALLVAAGLTRLPLRPRRAAIALVVATLLVGSSRLFTSSMFAKEDWRGVAQAVRAEARPVLVLDFESLVGLSPYLSPQAATHLAQSEADLTAWLNQGPFVVLVRSPRESAHALSKSAPFDPLTEGPESLRRWLDDHPGVPVQVRPFTGLALVTIGE